jgi:hypothetical protein
LEEFSTAVAIIDLDDGLEFHEMLTILTLVALFFYELEKRKEHSRWLTIRLP